MTATLTLAEELDALLRRDPAALADPYPLYHRLRAEDPVHRRGEDGTFWLLSRYADAAVVLRDPRFTADPSYAERNATFIAQLPEPTRSQFLELQRLDVSTMLFTDPPDHTRLRRLAHQAFTPRAVARLRDQIQRIVDELLDAAIPAGRMEVIRDLAYPLPVTVIAELLGVPEEDRERLRGWAATFETFQDGAREIEAAYTATMEFHEYLRWLITARRAHPQDDLVSALAAAEERGDMLSEDELLAMCSLLLNAGHVTTTNLIGNGLLALLRHPDQLGQLRDDPTLLPGAVEEMLRYDSPVQRTARTATVDVEIGGEQIRRGDLVRLLLGAANRDPAQFPDPDRFDIARPEVRHLAFGFGPHFCIGAALARLEGQIVFGTLLRRLPGLRLATDTLEYRANFVFHGLTALPVAWD